MIQWHCWFISDPGPLHADTRSVTFRDLSLGHYVCQLEVAIHGYDDILHSERLIIKVCKLDLNLTATSGNADGSVHRVPNSACCVIIFTEDVNLKTRVLWLWTNRWIDGRTGLIIEHTVWLHLKLVPLPDEAHLHIVAMESYKIWTNCKDHSFKMKIFAQWLFTQRFCFLS